MYRPLLSEDASVNYERTVEKPSRLERLFRGFGRFCRHFTFSQANSLIDHDTKSLNENSAEVIRTAECNPRQLLSEFESTYEQQRERKESQFNLLSTLFKQQRIQLLYVFLWTILEICLRLGMPIILREFLLWIQAYKEREADVNEGWKWGLLLALSPIVFTLIRVRTFWLGSLIGYRSQVTIIAAVHSKILRLNACAITRTTTGHITNLITSDAATMQEFLRVSPYLFIGPIETVAVLFMISYVLGFIPAIVGIGSILLMIPLQSILSTYLAKYQAYVNGVVDKRISMTTEVINGILAVKLLGWEDRLEADVDALRREESNLRMRKFTVSGFSSTLPQVAHSVVVTAMFTTYFLMDGELKMPDVFFALSLIALPKTSLCLQTFAALRNVAVACSSFKRLDAFFKLPDSPKVGQEIVTDIPGKIEIHNGAFGWVVAKKSSKSRQAQDPPSSQVSSKTQGKSISNKADEYEARQTLFDINFTAKPGELVGIAGIVGSGKSSLLSALVLDMERLPGSGRMRTIGSVAYCPQTPWIIAGSVRENILFGNPFDEEFYHQVIGSCALDIDLEQFPKGDQTEIGERGINLSGGQKARVSLARAVYSQADIYLLDDPLSAVDPKVGKILFNRCIGPDGLMKRGTRLLVTHQQQYLPLCDRIVVMEEGRIEVSGLWNEISSNPRFQAVLRQTSEHDQGNSSQPGDTSLGKTSANSESTNGANKELSKQSSSNNGARLVVDEHKEEGKVSVSVYLQYLYHLGVLPLIAALVAMASGLALYYVIDWWVATWASADEEDQRQENWVLTLLGLSSGQCVLYITGFVSILILTVRTATRLHHQMLQRVMHSPLKFFHTNPSGRIVNRFAKDMQLVDNTVPFFALEALRIVLQVVGMFVLVTIAVPYMLIFGVIVSWLFYQIGRRFVRTSREIKRFEATTRSYIYAVFAENLKGNSTIRAFKNADVLHDKYLDRVDLNCTWGMGNWVMYGWLSFRLSLAVGVIIMTTIVFAVSFAKTLPAAILGLGLVNVMDVTRTLQWATRLAAEVENAMTSVERVIEYTQLEQESTKAASTVPEKWPENGEIEYQSVFASYRSGLDPVLENVSFRIQGGNAVGIVGRTGSGKSSLLLTLFRLIDVNQGTIRIDGIDISTVELDVLRRHLAVIPQDPVLFHGTLRSNLDPWQEDSDARIWNVLKEVRMDVVVRDIGGLDATIAEAGSNFSVGQRQLLCLARSLLSDAKILALDEATANVDRATDALIQDSLRSIVAARDKTLLIIAHRIDTIMDCDMLLVLEDGKLAEIGSPRELTSRQGGVFAKMVSASKTSAH